MTSTTTIILHVGTWTAAVFSMGVALPIALATLAAGYILAGFVIERAGRTVLGTHVRHFFTRIAPAKRFHPSDDEYVRYIISKIQEDKQ